MCACIMPLFRVTKKLAKALGAKRQTSAVKPKASTINGSSISSSSRARSDGGLARADIEGINAQINSAPSKYLAQLQRHA